MHHDRPDSTTRVRIWQCALVAEMLSVVWATLLCLALGLGWLLTLLGMPGNWLMVAAAALYAWLAPGESRLAVGWQTVGALLIMALAGEVVEMVAGALGVARVGGSRRSAVLALFGSLIGGVMGIFVGLPVPIIGSLLAAVLFAGIGALAGAVAGETWKGRSLDASLQVGMAAFWGRLVGTLAKTLVASAMVAVALAALVIE
jgi:uncharacterized protein